MKIWIVSSDPFYRDFEKISEKWLEKGIEVEISLISKYNFNLRGVLDFCSTFLRIKPNVVLTDHGYFGFWFVKILDKLFNIKASFNFYLRGNYWLEERLSNEKPS